MKIDEFVASVRTMYTMLSYQGESIVINGVKVGPDLLVNVLNYCADSMRQFGIDVPEQKDIAGISADYLPVLSYGYYQRRALANALSLKSVKSVKIRGIEYKLFDENYIETTTGKVEDSGRLRELVYNGKIDEVEVLPSFDIMGLLLTFGVLDVSDEKASEFGFNRDVVKYKTEGGWYMPGEYTFPKFLAGGQPEKNMVIIFRGGKNVDISNPFMVVYKDEKVYRCSTASKNPKLVETTHENALKVVKERILTGHNNERELTLFYSTNGTLIKKLFEN